MADTLLPTSAFAAEPLSGPALRIAPVEGLSWCRMTLRTPDATLPTRPGAALRGPLTILWSGPRQYLACSEAAKPDFTTLAGLDADMTNLTGGRATVEITGDATRAVLAKLVPIDVHPSVFGPGAAGATLCSHIDVMLWNTGPAYRLSCSRSFARSLWRQITHAATEFLSPTH